MIKSKDDKYGFIIKIVQTTNDILPVTRIGIVCVRSLRRSSGSRKPDKSSTQSFEDRNIRVCGRIHIKKRMWKRKIIFG